MKSTPEEASMSAREIVTIGWDGASNPIRRYADELHLPDHARSTVVDRPPAPCGYCRRCAIHDDPGGCLEVSRWEEENPEAAIAALREANGPGAEWRIHQLEALVGDEDPFDRAEREEAASPSFVDTRTPALQLMSTAELDERVRQWAEDTVAYWSSVDETPHGLGDFDAVSDLDF